ncbi:J domain-containing protein [Natrarchaeobaculum sulfurireducens]|uniref:DnaJ-class molecular chaperone n=1 Tax=Natrarchaeobaculum sulfurireducens TaxID=2044521 RepID=A0A346PF35_9EURY|nr:DnaJ domain-containing protein [Natrarchaeobaculum sulfurireducens]AXR78130.1 DnaJ-class molecular chaperone [Natrarchaeobaculum sulfurireducens]
MGETYYEILEVAPDASREEIRSAYRERVLETHPDHNDAPDAADAFKRVSQANAVLTDETERARYDRLGHDAYVRFIDGSEERSPSDDPQAAAERVRSTDSASGGGHGSRGRGESHHARHRRERRRRTARRRASGNWPSGTTDASTRSDDSKTTHSGEDTTTSSDGMADDGGSTFQYAVHNWDGEVSLERDRRPLTQTTAVTLGCLWLLYPAFVASSLTAAFPLAVNAVVAACTLGIVAYLLTWPRIAAVTFGSWSLLIPVGLVAFDVSSPLSVVGLVALGFTWIPFGYAIGLWWALRP